MTKEEIKNKIEELETRKFFLAMKDRWTNRDYEIDRQLSNELRTLRETLKK